jgi:hypothetical protein
MPPEAQPREQDPSLGGHAVDQGARAAEALNVEIVPTADEVVEDLRAQLDDLDKRDKERDAELEAVRRRAEAAERARTAAENRAREADRSAREATEVAGRNVEEARLDAIKNALGTHEGHLKNLASQKAVALAEGDFSKSSELDAEMAKLGGRIAQLEAGQADLEERIKATPTGDAGRQVDQRAPRQDDPDQRKEAFIQSQPPRIQDWLRSDNGSRYFTDADFARKVAAAASYAQSIKNLSIDSQAYIDYVEEQVGLREPAPPEPARRDERAPSAPGHGRTADAGARMTTAPAGGSSEGSVRRNPNGTIDVYLTPGEKELARIQGFTDQEYAKNKRELIELGLIGPNARNR